MIMWKWAATAVLAAFWLGPAGQRPAPEQKTRIQPCPSNSQAETSCDRGDLDSCVQAGEAYAFCGNADGYRRAAGLYGRGCEGGIAAACRLLGGLHSSTGLVVEDPVAAAKAFDKASAISERDCAGGLPDACELLAEMLEAGQASQQVGRDVNSLFSKAAELREKQCGLGVVSECRRLADLLAARKLFGQSFQAYSRACNQGDGASCCVLGSLYSSGDKGVRRDPREAAAHFHRACYGGDAECCALAAYQHENGEGIPKSLARAAEFYEQGCSAGGWVSCFHLGLFYERGTGVPRDTKRAGVLLRKACLHGVTQACNQ